MSEEFTVIAQCDKPLTAKIWKQGGTAKCPGRWSFNTYPKPSLADLRMDIYRMCQNCEELKKEAQP